MYIIGPAKLNSNENTRSCIQDNPQLSPEHLNISVSQESVISVLSVSLSNRSCSVCGTSEELALL